MTAYNKHLPAVAALLCLLPRPAHAHGLYFSGTDMLLLGALILLPGILVAMVLMRGNLRTRLSTVFATIFTCLLFIPFIFIGFLLMGFYGLALGAALTLFVALYMNRTKDGSKPTPQTVSENFGNLFTNLLIFIALCVAGAYVYGTYKQYAAGEKLREDATNGKASAQRTMAWNAKTAEEALKWFRMAAEQGDALSQENLANRYRKGIGTPVDAKEALRWYLAAAPSKSLDVLRAIADMHRTGEGTERNIPEAIKWYETAAARAHAQERMTLYGIIGNIYETGEGVPADLVQAHYWYSRAATGDYGSAAVNALARVAAKLTPEQAAKSQEMLETALAETAEPPSTRALMQEASDRMHNDNTDPLAPPNYAGAAPLLREAANLGNAVAAARLCMMHMQGKGVAQDYGEAYFWCLLSKQRYALDPRAYYPDENPVGLAEQMRRDGTVTDAHIIEAERRLREWKPSKEQP